MSNMQIAPYTLLSAELWVKIISKLTPPEWDALVKVSKYFSDLINKNSAQFNWKAHTRFYLYPSERQKTWSKNHKWRMVYRIEREPQIMQKKFLNCVHALEPIVFPKKNFKKSLICTKRAKTGVVIGASLFALGCGSHLLPKSIRPKKIAHLLFSLAAVSLGYSLWLWKKAAAYRRQEDRSAQMQRWWEELIKSTKSAKQAFISRLNSCLEAAYLRDAPQGQKWTQLTEADGADYWGMKGCEYRTLLHVNKKHRELLKILGVKVPPKPHLYFPMPLQSDCVHKLYCNHNGLLFEDPVDYIIDGKVYERKELQDRVSPKLFYTNHRLKALIAKRFYYLFKCMSEQTTDVKERSMWIKKATKHKKEFKDLYKKANNLSEQISIKNNLYYKDISPLLSQIKRIRKNNGESVEEFHLPNILFTVLQSKIKSPLTVNDK